GFNRAQGFDDDPERIGLHPDAIEIIILHERNQLDIKGAIAKINLRLTPRPPQTRCELGIRSRSVFLNLFDEFGQFVGGNCESESER
ncbi:MAG: hypothetical protein ONB13_10495, partial [candidate division KSB1 bacterium]|nr:hypothetical protein [candidate division KSB1 bacterium]